MILMVVVNMFEEQFEISPGRAQIQVAWIGIPFVFAFFYGLFSESIPIFGSRKKSYLLIMSALEVMACLAVVLSPIKPAADSPWSVTLVTALLSLSSFASSWLDTIVDGLVVIQQRRDPQYGS